MKDTRGLTGVALLILIGIAVLVLVSGAVSADLP